MMVPNEKTPTRQQPRRGDITQAGRPEYVSGQPYSTPSRPQKQRLVQWPTYFPATSRLTFSTTW